MIIPDKKKAVGIIMSKMGDSMPGAAMKPEEQMDEGAPSAKLAIAQDLMLALKGDSAQDVADALSAFMAESENAEQE